MNKIIIEIQGWDKYNPRKDIKNPSWFAFSNRMIEDPDIYDLDTDEFKAWIYCLSRASQKACDTAEIDYRHALRICNITQVAFENMFRKMEKSIKVRLCTPDVQTPYAHVHPSVHDRQTDKQTDNGNFEADEIKKTNDEVFATYHFTEGYPRNVFDEYAREAWPLFFSDDNPNKKWKRFLANYIKNNKHRIREHAIELSKIDKPISAYMKDFFPDQENV